MPTPPTPRSLPLYGLALIFAASLLGACGDDGGGIDARLDAPSDAPDGSGTVELGTGTIGFLTLEAEDDLILWAGPQGGYHFLVHARIQDLAPGDWQMPGQPGNPTTTFSAYDESGAQVDLMLPPYVLGYRDEGDGWLYLPSGRLLRIDDTRVAELYGTRVRLHVRVEDVDGNVATDERWVRAITDPQTVDAGVPDAFIPAP